MLKNYLKIAFRNLFKNRTYSIINLLGLAIGIASCLLIVLYVMDELSFDSYHENKDRIYRVTLEKFEEDGTTSRDWAAISPGYGPKLQEQFPAIQKAARFWLWSNPVITANGKKFVEEDFAFAEQAVFDIFTIPFTHGQPGGALTDPNSIVLTESTARRYFGEDNPIGETLVYSDYDTVLTFAVTGVVRDVPPNSHFTYDFLASFNAWEGIYGTEFMDFMGGSFNFPTYLLLGSDQNIEVLGSQFPDFLDRNMADIKGRRPHDVFTLHLQPLPEIYLQSDLNSSYGSSGDINQVIIFSAIAFMVLLIACINFISLATARASRRAKEIGLRKVLGADRTRLIMQFLGESLVQTVLALLLALGLAEAFLSQFNSFTGKALSIGASIDLILVLTVILIFVSLVAGGYPALFLSRLMPVRTLKAGQSTLSAKSRFRSVLVVFQFAVSIGLIVGVVTVEKQLHFLNSKGLGFDKERLIYMPASSEMIERLEVFKQELKQNPGIVNVTATSRVPSGFLNDALDARVLSAGELQPVGFRLPFVRVDHDFFTSYGMEIIAGRGFSREFSTDSTEAFVVNETAAAQLGWESPQAAVGQPMGYGNNEGRIVGVVQDFHFESLQLKIKPMVFILSPFLRFVSVRLAAGSRPETLDFLKQKWLQYRPDYPFTYNYIDARFARLYQSEKKLSRVFGVFSGLAIFIACLGLFGLAAFAAEQKTKEIGIRKVLGASVASITFMLTKQFSIWVIVANLVSWPIAGLALNRWLQSFAYRIDLAWWAFLLAGALALFIALLTICTLSVRAALANPVESLRYE